MNGLDFVSLVHSCRVNRVSWFLFWGLIMRELTEKQLAVVNFVISESEKIGRGVGFRDIAAFLGDENGPAAINTVTGHIKGIRDKTGKTLLTWEDTPKGGIKANSLRSAKMTGGGSSPNCRNGNGWSVVLTATELAFTIFSDEGILKHDRLPVLQAIGFCDNFKIDSNLPIIDRIAKLAEKVAAKEAAKVAAS